MDTYVRFSELAFLLVHDPIAAEVVAVEAVIAARRRTLAPDAPPGINRARRKLVQHALSYMRRRRIARLLPWVKKRSDGLDLTDDTRRVWEAVGSLRPRQQVAVILARIEGANLTEIADALGFSTGAAGTHLDKARDHLARALAGDDLRLVLTRSLGEVARAFTRTYRPDPSFVEPLVRADRWRTWTLLGGAMALVGAAAFTLLRG